MPITPFPYGLSSFGAPVIGGASGFGFSSASTIYFVDGTNGSDGNDGLSPENAFSTIYHAITIANAWDVIYIIPKAWTSGGLWLNTNYTEAASYDLSIPYAKQGLALIGVGHQGLIGQAYDVVISEASASTSCVLKSSAPMCAFENLAFEHESTETGGGLYIDGETAGTYDACLTSVYNCHFHGIGGTTSPIGYGGALIGYAVWGLTITKCSFLECRIGVAFQSSGPSAGNLTVQDCVFRSRYASAASDISADIWVYTQGSTNILIRDSYFAHLIPSLSGGLGCLITVQPDVREGLIANNHFGGAIGTTYTQGYGGTGINVPTNVGLGANYCNGALMPVVSA